MRTSSSCNKTDVPKQDVKISGSEEKCKILGSGLIVIRVRSLRKESVEKCDSEWSKGLELDWKETY